LLFGAAQMTGNAQFILALGGDFQFLVCVATLASRRSWRQPLGPSIITLYLIGLGWLWAATAQQHHWYPHFAQAILLIVPLMVFASQTLTSSGAATLRRARILAQRIAARNDWPCDLANCRTLPEVKAFRESLHLDATPALDLLENAHVPVRVAALAALEYRKNWRLGQAEYVLHVARKTTEPAVRSGAILALANLEERVLVESLAEFLDDSSFEVRRATTEALLWDTERRWPWIRLAIRQNLASQAYQGDGPMRCDGHLLPDTAIADLRAWAAEKGILGVRAAQTLGAQYSRLLNEKPTTELIEGLQGQLIDPAVAPSFRLELAQVLRGVGKWDEDLLKKLLGPANPAPLRLIAADALLSNQKDEDAMTALFQIARLPNREIALATADVAQRRLGVDLGLQYGKPLPGVQTRQAAEITRRVMSWAAQRVPGAECAVAAGERVS
jgi:hypothetical protein